MKCENSINAKFDALTNSLCSINERINEICSETKRKTDESGECVCVVDNKIDNGVSKSDTVDSSSDIDNRNVVEVRVFSDHHEREYRGSLNEESVQSCLLYTFVCISVSVVVGFLYILNLCLCSSFVMERSKKFMV